MLEVASLPSRERGLKSVRRGLRPGGLVSLPSRERGLKLDRTPLLVSRRQVAPFTGAWIEIRFPPPQTTCQGSLPSRERGLKFPLRDQRQRAYMSLPSRERGLK